MAVNGGGGVTLQFQRSPLKATTRTTYLPWNRIIVIHPVVMTPYGGAGISWDEEEDTSVKVRIISAWASFNSAKKGGTNNNNDIIMYISNP
jgi:hypothetical protein